MAGILGTYHPQCQPKAASVRGEFTLLYGGIAPKAPPQNGKPASCRTLSHRIRYHLTGNGSCSTLRLTLGCLLGLEPPSRTLNSCRALPRTGCYLRKCTC